MSYSHELTKKVTSSVQVSSTNIGLNNQKVNPSKKFDSVLTKAFQNNEIGKTAGGCCCNDFSEKKLSEEIKSADLSNISESEATSSEKISAGSSFTMFIKVSARICGVAGEVINGKFRDTTLAFADALKSDRTYNENLLDSFLEKIDEKITSQTSEIKTYLSNYIDEIFAGIKSSNNSLNYSLLGSSRFLGDAFSNSSNFLGNLGLGAGFNSGTMLSGLFDSSSSSYSTGIVGSAALDIANAKLTASMSNSANLTYGGVNASQKRYAGRTLEIVKSSKLEIISSSNLENNDKAGKDSSDAALTSLESSNSVVADAVSDKDYLDAFKRKNNIIELFKEMIQNSMSISNCSGNEESKIKNFDAKVDITLV